MSIQQWVTQVNQLPRMDFLRVLQTRVDGSFDEGWYPLSTTEIAAAVRALVPGIPADRATDNEVGAAIYEAYSRLSLEHQGDAWLSETEPAGITCVADLTVEISDDGSYAAHLTVADLLVDPPADPGILEWRIYLPGGSFVKWSESNPGDCHFNLFCEQKGVHPGLTVQALTIDGEASCTMSGNLTVQDTDGNCGKGQPVVVWDEDFSDAQEVVLPAECAVVYSADDGVAGVPRGYDNIRGWRWGWDGVRTVQNNFQQDRTKTLVALDSSMIPDGRTTLQLRTLVEPGTSGESLNFYKTVLVGDCVCGGGTPVAVPEVDAISPQVVDAPFNVTGIIPADAAVGRAYHEIRVSLVDGLEDSSPQYAMWVEPVAAGAGPLLVSEEVTVSQAQYARQFGRPAVLRAYIVSYTCGRARVVGYQEFEISEP